VRRTLGVAAALAGLLTFFVLFAGSATAIQDPPFADDEDTTALSGPLDMRGASAGTNLTECPQAGLRSQSARPDDHRALDSTEQKSNAGDDIRVNQDYSCMTQDEIGRAHV